MEKIINYGMYTIPNGTVRVLKKGKAYECVEGLSFDDFEATNNYDEDVVITKNSINGEILNDELYGDFSLTTGKFIQFYSVYQNAYVGQYDENGDINLSETITACISKLNKDSLENIRNAKNNFQKMINNYNRNKG